MPDIQPIAFPFDVSAIDPYVGGSEPLPSGTYPMSIQEMECVANNNKATGHNLRNVYVVIEGEFKGRKVYENLNLWHSGSSQAVEIAFKQLSSIGHAVGVLAGQDLTVLANKPMMVEVALEPGTEASVDGNGKDIKARGPSNRIVRRDPYQAQQSGAPMAQAAAQAPAFQPGAQPTSAPAQQTQAPAFQQMPAQQQPPVQQAPAQQAAPVQNAAPGAPGAAATPPWANK
jgi:hypothetical protein